MQRALRTIRVLPLIAAVAATGYLLRRHPLPNYTLLVGWVVIAYTFRARRRGQDANTMLTAAGLDPRPALPHLFAGFVFGAAVFSLVIGVLVLRGWYHAGPLVLRAADLLYALAFFFLVGLTEEFIARGLIFRAIERKLGTWRALAISAAIFGGLHLPNPHASVLAAAAIAIEAGLLLGGCYVLTRSLWLAIGVHWAWNMFEGPVFGTPVSGTKALTRLFHSTTTGPVIWTGGTFGPEAGLGALFVGTAAGVLVLALAVRRGQIRSRVPVEQDPEPSQRQPGLDRIDTGHVGDDHVG